MKLIASALTAGLLSATIALAQTPPAPGAKPAPAAKGSDAKGAPSREVVGKIKSTDPESQTVLLEDGTRLVIPGSVKVDPTRLKPGASVKARVEQKGGQNVVTALEVM